MGILMISPLIVCSQKVKVSQKRCLGTSVESFTSSSPSEQIIVLILHTQVWPLEQLRVCTVHWYRHKVFCLSISTM